MATLTAKQLTKLEKEIKIVMMRIEFDEVMKPVTKKERV